jgi:hypothetical protein
MKNLRLDSPYSADLAEYLMDQQGEQGYFTPANSECLGDYLPEAQSALRLHLTVEVVSALTPPFAWNQTAN